MYVLYNESCESVMARTDENTFDSCICDPPYGLKFMNKRWDHGVPGLSLWEQMLRITKPGGFLLAFGSTRTDHKLKSNIEDAGWELRNTIIWMFASGFPKSLNVHAEILRTLDLENALTDAAKECIERLAEQWLDYGTDLKPAYEPIVVARKPLKQTVAKNVLEYGTGALNIGACRVGENPGYKYDADKNGVTFHGEQGKRISYSAEKAASAIIESTKARFPSNIIHDGSDVVTDLFPDNRPGCKKPSKAKCGSRYREHQGDYQSQGPIYGDDGSASRFFYCAKANKNDRNRGGVVNNHPTVKPGGLMRYLCRLVTPKGGIIFDGFAGSGSTLLAAEDEGFDSVGCEIEKGYCDIAEARLCSAGRAVK